MLARRKLDSAGFQTWTVGGQVVARLYLGSCFDLFDMLADCDPADRPRSLFSDPPYPLTTGGRSADPKSMGGKFSAERYANDGKIVAGTDLAFTTWIRAALPALQPDSDLVIMSNDRNLRDLLNAAAENAVRFHRLLVWARQSKTPNRWIMAGAEFALYGYAGKSRPVINKPGADQITSIHGFKSATDHPTEKPVGLFAQWIGDITTPGELIFDPFTGTGAAALGALRIGRRFIGSEIDPRHFGAACRRIDDALSAGPLFANDRPTLPLI